MPQLRRGLIVCLLAFLCLGAAVNLEAKTWKVDPTMTRAAIQAVIDSAADNDTIRFAKGNYDFSATPFSTKPWSGGALVITDKSLKFVADKGVILLGTDSIIDPGSGIGMSGIIAFNVMNSVTKDISFKGFTFRKFLFGVISGIETSFDPVTGDVMASSCRDFTVQNCTFQEIHRAAISATGVQRNIKILNNKVVWSRRFGMFLDWYWVGDYTGTEPKTGKITITNNEIHARIECVLIQRGYNRSIKNNTFDAAGSDYLRNVGLEVSDGANAPSIVNNKFTNLTYGLKLDTWDFVSGATVFSYPMTKGNITNNKINAFGGIWAGGSDGACHDNKFANNVITVNSAIIVPNYKPWGIGAFGSCNNLYIGNKILGTGNVALTAQGWDDTASGGDKASTHNELFKNNSVKGFVVNGVGVDYYMNPYTHDNTAIGKCPEKATYYDEGVNNIFKCIFLVGTGGSKLKNGFALSPRNHIDRTPLER
jgi:hypothetical protein